MTPIQFIWALAVWPVVEVVTKVLIVAVVALGTVLGVLRIMKGNG